MAVDASIFDSIARILARVFSRRALLTALGGFPLVRLPHTLGAQLSPATCGASGDVCTRIAGCCSGLTCVTSAINVNYGVCIAGGGGTVSVGTSLISPFSEGVELEIAALLNSAALTETTSTSSATESTTTKKERRDVRIAENKAIQDARKAEAQLRRDQQKLDSRNRRRSRSGTQSLSTVPRLQLELFFTNNPEEPEIVRLTNLNSVSVTVSEIKSIPPLEGIQLSPPYELGAGKNFLFVSGVPNHLQGIVDNRYAWVGAQICGAASGDGFSVFAGFSSDSVNNEYVIMCDQTVVGANNRKPKKRKMSKSKNKKRSGG